MKKQLKYILLGLLAVAISAQWSCTPDEFIEIEREPFVAYSLELSDMPVVSVSPTTGATKTFTAFMSHPTDSIAKIIVRNRSHDLEVTGVFLRMTDSRNPVEIAEDGTLSRKLSTVIFDYRVRIPSDFAGKQYTMDVVAVTGKGEERVIKLGFNGVNYFTSTTALDAYNGRVLNNGKQYLSTANCFLTFRLTRSIVADFEDPSIVDTLYSGIVSAVVNPANATNTVTNRRRVFAHVFTEIQDLDKRLVYLVSPDESWIGDSLRILNNFTTRVYPHEQMLRVRYVDLGPIDWMTMTDDVYEQVDFASIGQAKIQVMPGHSYAFETSDGQVGVLLCQFIRQYSASYSNGSPNAFFRLKLKYPEKGSVIPL